MAITRGALASRDVHFWAITVRSREIGYWRATVADILRGWCAREETVALGQQGVSELLANVACHVDDPRCGLRLSRAEGNVLVEVLDRSGQPPRVGSRPNWSAERGRGLWLLREMADDFGYMPAPYPEGDGLRMGKVVWFSCRGAVPGAPAQ
ncbi:ATP-binding protein [Streptomyces triticirhizae]|uniref:ATP-binding protein n=1 Tax=Streptomyces triticirhizae TaxID=2483353 RepID=UPI0011C4A426|nr:ATP-binding protein [Streptomyces triticirhizae]